MILKKLLQQPRVSENLVFPSPFKQQSEEKLVAEVIGLANANIDGPRYIIFGVHTGTMDGNDIVGIDESAMAGLKRANQLVARLIKPFLQLAFIFDEIDGKLVGALEIDECCNAPYVVRQDYSKRLKRGQAWIRKGMQLRDVDPIHMEEIRARVARKHAWPIKIGFNDVLDCELLELNIPDTSDPPSVLAKQQTDEKVNWKEKAHDAFGTISTQISRLLHTRDHGIEAEFDDSGIETIIAKQAKAEDTLEFAEADNYYFFEERALKLNLTICNTGDEWIDDLNIELLFPRTADFDVADHLYKSPDDTRSQLEIDMLDYPDVQHREDTVVVRAALRNLAANSQEQVFGAALRLAVKPKMRGAKVAIKYTLRAKNKQSTATGRLRLKLN